MHASRRCRIPWLDLGSTGAPKTVQTCLCWCLADTVLTLVHVLEKLS